jgi:hypothetical protein
MGFDDIVHDYDIKQKTMETLRPLIGQYNYEKWDRIEEMETGDLCYSAYSLIFRQIHSINTIIAVGASSLGLTDEQKTQISKSTRLEVLMLFFDEVEDYDIQRKITAHLDPLLNC